MIKTITKHCLLACLFLLSFSLYASEIIGPCTDQPDAHSRIALLSAYQGEADLFIDAMRREENGNSYTGCTVINGHRYVLGRLEGKDVVVGLSNVGIVNAAMIMQLTLDRFTVSEVIYSGIAGGIGGSGANDDNPVTDNMAPLGSVVIPGRWGFHQAAYFSNSATQLPCVTISGLQLNYHLQSDQQEQHSCEALLSGQGKAGKVDRRSVFKPDAKNVLARNTNVSNSAMSQFYLDADNKQQLRHISAPGADINPATEQQLKFWFQVDGSLLEKARHLSVDLLACPDSNDPVTASGCSSEPLDPAPHLLVGHNGVSGSAFVDNRKYRQYLANNFNFADDPSAEHHEVLIADMESAAAAQVAFSNDVPFIAIRSVSDLAGGGEATAASELNTFFAVAAENQYRVVSALLRVM